MNKFTNSARNWILTLSPALRVLKSEESTSFIRRAAKHVATERSEAGAKASRIYEQAIGNRYSSIAAADKVVVRKYSVCRAAAGIGIACANIGRPVVGDTVIVAIAAQIFGDPVRVLRITLANRTRGVNFQWMARIELIDARCSNRPALGPKSFSATSEMESPKLI